MLSENPHKRITTYGIKHFLKSPQDGQDSNEEWHFKLPPKLSHSSSLESCS